MITNEQIVDVLKSWDKKPRDIRIADDGFVDCRIPNLIDPEKPHLLVIDPVAEANILRICIPSLVRIPRPGLFLHKGVCCVNDLLSLGRVGLTTRNGLNFTLEHVCRDGDEVDPSPQVLKQMLDCIVTELPEVEKILLQCIMIDSGMSRTRSDQVMNALFPEDELDGDE